MAPRHAYIHDSSSRLARFLLAKGATAYCSYAARFLKGAKSDGGYGTSTPLMMQYAVRETFFLDALVLVSYEGGQTPVRGFIGMVQEGGANAQMRDMSRRGSAIRLEHGGHTYIVLNDAGLNTYGFASVDHVGEGTDVNPENWIVFRNYHDIKYTLRNAFYGTAQWTLHGMISPSTAGWQQLDSGTLSPGQEVTGVFSGELTVPPVVAGTQLSLSVRLDIVNQEGTRSVQTQSVPLYNAVRKITVYKTNDRTEPWNSGEEMEIYIGEDDYETVHVIAGSAQDTLIPADDLPDGGRAWRLVSGFVELSDGMYNVWANSGFRYLNHRITYLYKPNSETAQPHWKLIVGVRIDRYGSDEGWPEAASSGYMYRIAFTARYVAVAGITTAPPSVQVSGISLMTVNEDGLAVFSMTIDRSSWDEDTVLSLGGSVRSTESDTCMYAKEIAGVTPAYGMKPSYTSSPSSVENEAETTAIPYD